MVAIAVVSRLKSSISIVVDLTELSSSEELDDGE